MALTLEDGGVEMRQAIRQRNPALVIILIFETLFGAEMAGRQRRLWPCHVAEQSPLFSPAIEVLRPVSTI